MHWRSLAACFTLVAISCTYAEEINGNWESWSQWSSCSVTCNGGTRTRSRTCTNPAPQCVTIVDGAFDDEGCNDQPCPVNGNWTTWSQWSSCSVTCSGGTRTRSRTCTNPSPANGGSQCVDTVDDGFDDEGCNDQRCPINGNWTTWSQWSSCSVTCGGGNRNRSRTCTNPSPANGGSQCVDTVNDGFDDERCNDQRCPILTDESYNYGAILGVDLDECWGLLRAGRSEAERKSLVPTVYICNRNKFREAMLSNSNMRLALDRVQVELSCRMNFTDLSSLRELDARNSSVMDFRTNRTTVGVYGDPHLRTYQRPQLTTCASAGAQVYLRSRILDISGVNSKLCPESRATFLSQVTFNFKSLLNPDVVTARYDARNGQHPAQIEQLISDVIAADLVRLEYLNLHHIRMIWNHTGVVIDFSKWGSSYFFTLRVAESVLQGGEGLLVEGCPGDMILDRGLILNDVVGRCEVEVGQLVPPTPFESRQASIGTIGATTPQPPSRPNTSTIDTTPERANSLTVVEAISACENRSHVTDDDVMLLMGDNLEMCMFDVLVTGDPEYVIMAVEAVHSQIEAIEMDPVIRAEASTWTFIEAELPTTEILTTTPVTPIITGSAYTPVGTSPLPDGCTLDDAKIVGLLAMVCVLLVILVILVVIIIILWRRIPSQKHKSDIDNVSQLEYERCRNSDGVQKGNYDSLKNVDRPKTDAPLEMASFNGSSGLDKDGEADVAIMSKKKDYLTVKNDAKNDAYEQPCPSRPIDDDVDVYMNVAENDG